MDVSNLNCLHIDNYIVLQDVQHCFLEPLNNAFSLFNCPTLFPDKNKFSSMHSTISEKKLSRKIAVIPLML